MACRPLLPTGTDYGRPAAYGARTGPREAATLVVGTSGGSGAALARSAVPSPPAVDAPCPASEDA